MEGEHEVLVEEGDHLVEIDQEGNVSLRLTWHDGAVFKMDGEVAGKLAGELIAGALASRLKKGALAAGYTHEHLEAVTDIGGV